MEDYMLHVSNILKIDLAELNPKELEVLYKCLWSIGRLNESQKVDDAYKVLTGEYVKLGKKF